MSAIDLNLRSGVSKSYLEGGDFFVLKPKSYLEGGVVPRTPAAPTHLFLRSQPRAGWMVSPPWFLTAPDGRVHYVASAATLLDLAKKHDLVQGAKQENLLRRLVDPSNKKVRAGHVFSFFQAPTACPFAFAKSAA